jgi:hypothetical protein
MNTKPILFSTPMVQTILEGRKTQTRRIIKPQPCKEAKKFERFIETVDCGFEARFGNDISTAVCDRKTKYKLGEILWVRETWRIGAWNKDSGCIAVDYKAGNYTRREWIKVEDQNRFERYWIESTHDAIKAGIKPDANGEYHWEPGQAPTRWRPSIHMPRKAARIFLQVTNVRIERLQIITEEDAMAEGVKDPYDYQESDYYEQKHMRGLEINKSAFAGLWDSIYAAPKTVKNEEDEILYYESYPWEDIQETREYKGKPWYVHGNPWVLVYEFERVDKPCL